MLNNSYPTEISAKVSATATKIFFRATIIECHIYFGNFSFIIYQEEISYGIEKVQYCNTLINIAL